MNRRRKAALALAAAAIGLIAVVCVPNRGEIQAAVMTLLESIRGLGPWAPLIFIAAYVLQSVFLLPVSILAPAAGILFGIAKGTLTVMAGTTLGAAAAFLISRRLARGWVARKLASAERFRLIDEWIASRPVRFVILTRLSPVTPFKSLSYVYGVTRVSFSDYLFGTLIGTIPSAFLYVYLGTLIGDLAALGSEARPRTSAELMVSAGGLIATALIFGGIARAAGRRLKA